MKRALLGMLTPSSNTVLEPITSEMLRSVPEASAHFGRFAVTQIALSTGALAQFATTEVLKAAELLSHAKCQVIGWSGTSSSWLGFDSDERLCHSIESQTQARACTSVLAMLEILRKTQVRRLGLVTPYTTDVQMAIMRNFSAAGYEVVAEQHTGLKDNFSFSEVSEQALTDMVEQVVQARPDAILILCTNLRGAPLVPAWERRWRIPIYDSVATVVWKALCLTESDPKRLQAWGSLFSEVA